VTAVASRLVELLPPGGPALVHGDLWWGNVLFGSDGRSWLIDPSVHGGHPEEDLAMLALFGPVPERLVRAYDEVHPLSSGWQDRVALFQLYRCSSTPCCSAPATAPRRKQRPAVSFDDVPPSHPRTNRTRWTCLPHPLSRQKPIAVGSSPRRSPAGERLPRPTGALGRTEELASQTEASVRWGHHQPVDGPAPAVPGRDDGAHDRPFVLGHDQSRGSCVTRLVRPPTSSVCVGSALIRPKRRTESISES